MKNGVNKITGLELPAQPALRKRAVVVAVVLAAVLGVGGLGYALVSWLLGCPEGQMYSGDAGRCITPE